MRIYAPFILLLTVLTFSPMKAQDLKDYQWKNRILVLFDEEIDTPPLQSQLKAFAVDQEALTDRNLIIFLITENGVYDDGGESVALNAERLRNNLGIEKDFTGTVLIGKDGGVKLKKEFHVDPETIFTLIDGMPMRRSEMRKSGKS